ncbi:hypothetical protein WDW89_20535 [Deltaproteobacteria bacterium TL4]
MTPQERKKLERIARALEDATVCVRELLAEPNSAHKKEASPTFNTASELTTLKAMKRSDAEAKLSEMKQIELGAVFVVAGGAPSEKKRPKVWLIEQILWRVFDFDRGHDVIRSKGTGES